MQAMRSFHRHSVQLSRHHHTARYYRMMTMTTETNQCLFADLTWPLQKKTKFKLFTHTLEIYLFKIDNDVHKNVQVKETKKLTYIK